MAPKKRTRDKHLPPRVYIKFNAYYYVTKQNKWIRLGAGYSEAMQKWIELTDSLTSSKTMNALFDRYISEIAIKKSIKSYQDNLYQVENLRKVFGHVHPKNIKPKHIYKYLDERGKLAPFAANREKALLSHVFSLAIRWGVIEANPCNGVKNLSEARRDHYIPNHIFTKVRDSMPRQMGLIIDFAYLTGLRQGDILKLKLETISHDGIFMGISKTDSKLLIEWTDDLRSVVNKATAIAKERNSEYLFCNRKGLAYTPDGFRTLWQRNITKLIQAQIIAQEDRFRFHDIRRKAASDLEQCFGREAARKLLGHSNQNTTGIYISGPQRVKPLTLIKNPESSLAKQEFY